MFFEMTQAPHRSTSRRVLRQTSRLGETRFAYQVNLDDGSPVSAQTKHHPTNGQPTKLIDTENCATTLA